MSTDLNTRFDFHPADEDTGNLHTAARQILKAAAENLDVVVPEGREKSLVLTNLEQALFWANAGIARS